VALADVVHPAPAKFASVAPMRICFPVVMLASLLAVAACDVPAPTSPVVGLRGPIDPPQPPDLGNYIDRDITVHVLTTDDLRKYCLGTDPFFHYDSDRVTHQEQPDLFGLVSCMQDGPLKNKRIELIGRADPRGSVPFNAALGMERAERVKKFFVDHGIAPDRIVTKSAGKTDAAPQPSKWRTDRRVDIDVLP
jgi:OOP family OmpA-OmpF porin